MNPPANEMTIRDLKAYTLIEERELPDIHARGFLLRHDKSGARVAAVSCDDENKVFCIGFKTPPEDSCGTPHIIEHTVLCGSRKYLVKDPFVELAKGSMKTFLNAMTYPDKTLYPVASCNGADFQNLMDVYMDAVFYPDIFRHEEIFRQEGWHYEMEGMDDPIAINGVVYNEMKGAFSSPDDLLSREVMRSLFPDTPYRHESGGDPERIPDLSYEEYLDFYRRHYDPSNAYIYLYGDMDMAEKLSWMDEEYLGRLGSGSQPCEAHAMPRGSVSGEGGVLGKNGGFEIPLQKPFDKPIEVVSEYPASSSDPEEGGAFLSYNMVIGDCLDRQLSIAFDVLSYALLDAPGAPLKKALIDAGIGKDVDGGYDDGMRQPVFSIVAKYADVSQKDRFLAVVRDTLRRQAEEGIDGKAILAGISSSEFRFREADYGRYPKGLLYGLSCYDSWMYDEGQPFLYLEALDTYRFLREQAGSGYFEGLVKKYMLDNPHASFVAITPKKGLGEARDAALREKLSAYKASLSEGERKSLIEATRHLKEYQEEPSAREDLEKIPTLSRADLRREAMPIDCRREDSDGTVFLFEEMVTNGIIYQTLLFDMHDVPIEDLPYVGILKAALGFVDTESYGYDELANEINIHTGGMSTGVGVYPDAKGAGGVKVFYELRFKALSGELGEATRLAREILTTSKVSDEKRLREIIAQQVAQLQAYFASSGDSAASVRALSYFSRHALYEDQISGIGYYRVVSDFDKNFDEKKDFLVEKLSSLIGRIFTRERLFSNATLEPEDRPAAEAAVLSLKPALWSGTPESDGLPPASFSRRNEGFMGASQVQYVARAGNYRAHGDPYSGAMRVLRTILEYDYLWIRVRVKGGAYGCMLSFLRNGDSCVVSYRDPNLAATNEVYEGIPSYIESFDADERAMTRYVIGTVASMDMPLNPNARGRRVLTAYLQGINYEDLQRERDEVLGARPEDVRALSGIMEDVLSDGCVCVIGNEEALRGEPGMFGSLESL